PESRLEFNLLRTYRVKTAQKAARHIRVGVVQNVQGVSRLGLPREHFDHAFASDRYRWTNVARHPSHRVLNQLAEIGISRAPERPVYIASKVCYARCAFLLENGGRLIRARSAREDHFRRERRIVWHDAQRERRSFSCADGQSILRAREKICTVKSADDRVL